MPDNAARTMRQGRAGIVRAMLLLVRAYNAAKNIGLTAPIWPVKHDKDMGAFWDMNDKSKPALSLVTPQARHHYTRLDQIDRLIEAEESDSAIGYMGRLMALCSLPRTNPGNRKEFKRVNGPITLGMIAGLDNKLPFGHIPRLLLAWVCTEAVRTQSRDLVLGKTLSDFMRAVGIDPAGASYARVRNQMKRFFACQITLLYTGKQGESRVSSLIADRSEFWWTERSPGDPRVFNRSIRLGEEFFNEVIAHPIPVDIHILKALSRCSLGLDLYQWLNYRTFGLDRPVRVSWKQLYRQFWGEPSRDGNSYAVRHFRSYAVRELKKIKVAWPGLDYATPRGALELFSTTTPSVPPRQLYLLSR